MIPALAVFVLLDAAVLAVWALVVAVGGRAPGPGLLGGLVLLEVTLVAQAVLDGAGSFGDRPAAEPAVHLGYLVTSVMLLPGLLGLTRPPGPHARPDRVSTWVIAVACVALAVVDARLIATGADARAR